MVLLLNTEGWLVVLFIVDLLQQGVDEEGKEITTVGTIRMGSVPETTPDESSTLIHPSMVIVWCPGWHRVVDRA